MAERVNRISTPIRAAVDQVNAFGSGLTSIFGLANDPVGTVFGGSAGNILNGIGNFGGGNFGDFNIGGGVPFSPNGFNAPAAQPANDFRMRLKAQNPSTYGNGIMGVLRETNGMLFPYTPSVQVSQDVNYSSLEMTHANTDYYSYKNTPNVSISVTGKFTAQNNEEGAYCLACLHFLRTMSKMYFGLQDASAGLAGIPPPVLLLNGYGPYMFNNIKVLLQNHSYTLDENTDMITVPAGSSFARIPALFTISITLKVQQVPAAMREQFSLNSFRSGELLSSGSGGWI